MTCKAFSMPYGAAGGVPGGSLSGKAEHSAHLLGWKQQITGNQRNYQSESQRQLAENIYVLQEKVSSNATLKDRLSLNI